MTLFLRLYVITCTALLSGYALADDNNDIYQSIQLGITQQSQLFEFNDTSSSSTRLNVWGSRIQYQVGKGPWNLIMDYHQGDASDEDTHSIEPYSLDFETKSYGAFIEYNLENIWLAMGFNNSEDATNYRVDTSDQNEFKDDNQINYQSITLESGYIHYTQSGQFSAALGLSQQQVKEKQYTETNSGNNGQASASQIDEYTINEDGILTSLTLSYGHFFPLSQSFQLALNAGLRREITLSGDGRIQQPSRNLDGPNSNQSSSDEELQSTSQSASTSQQAHISLQHKRGSISLNLDKLSDQSFAHSYFSAALSIYF